MRIVLLDDYNQRIPANQDIIGTVTTNWCEASLRHGWKIIEIYESERDERGLLVQGKVHPCMGGGFTTTPQWSSSGERCPDCQGL